ncbi:MAG: hypothetical protein NTV36_02090 [Candidatus Staskawiczbacteria bacterium]|nr:hypothetical protein [Candidatus Staskawiczbacteria bacterium]
MFKFKKQAGQASRLLLVLAVISLVAVVIVYLVMKMAERPPKPAGPATVEIPMPVYEKQLGDIRFLFESSINRGRVLRASELINSQYSPQSTKDLMTGEKFITVTIGAQNKGTTNTEQNAWDIENIVDSEGRNFVPLEAYAVGPWLPYPNLCGALLKPAFDPTPCTKIYEVSKEATGLKIRVKTGKDNNSASSLSSGKVDEVLIDLIVK